MKDILPIFAVVAVAVAAGGIVAVRSLPADAEPAEGEAVTQYPAETYAESERPARDTFDSPASQGDPNSAPSAGQRLADRAAHDIAAHASISARIRQRVHLFGQQLVGQGNYLQLGTGPDQLMRLELTIQAGERSTLRQVCDGRFLWLYRSLPEGDRLGRVDLRRVRRAVERAGQGRTEGGPDRRGSLPATRPIGSMGFDALALGGLPRLLDSLSDRFQFQNPKSETFNGEAVWSVWGEWKPDRLAQLLPEQREVLLRGDRVPPDAWPVQLPVRVRLVLGQDDLFPYRIEFYGLPENVPAAKSATPTEGDGSALVPPAAAEPMVAMDLFEVTLGAAIDPLDFAFKPGDMEVTDATDTFIARLIPPADEPDTSDPDR